MKRILPFARATIGMPRAARSGWFFLLTWGLLLPFFAFSQAVLPLTGLLRYHPQSNLIHPAYAPAEPSLVVGIPLLSSLSVDLRNDFSHADLFTSVNSRSNLLNVSRLYKDILRAKNFFSAQVNENLLCVGYKNAGGNIYTSLYVNERADVFLGYPKSIVQLLWEGNASLLGGRDTYEDLLFDALYFREIGFTASIKSNGPISVGIGFKFLQGLANMGLSRNAGFEVAVAADTYAHTLNPKGTHLRAAGLPALLLGVDDGSLGVEQGGNLSGALMGGDNFGFGFDVGLHYPIEAIDLNLALSLNDVGYVDWRSGVEYYQFKYSTINFSGVGTLEGDDTLERLNDTVDDIFSLEETQGEDAESDAYRSVLPASLLFTADKAFLEGTGLVVGSFWVNRRAGRYFCTPLLGYTHTFFRDLHLSASFLVPVLDTFAVGFTTAYNPGPFHVYLSVSGVPNVTKLQAPTFSFGMNLTLGRDEGEVEDAIYIEPPESRKRERFLR